MYLKTFRPLLQNDYGEEMDCSLTSITACTVYLLHRSDDNHIYSITESAALLWGYSGTRHGTFSITIKPIWEQVLEACGKPGKVTAKYFKGIGYNLGMIQEQLGKGNPVILNVSNINNTSYKNHTITIVGFEGEKLFIYDNWSRVLRQIYYKDISFGSSINYMR